MSSSEPGPPLQWGRCRESITSPVPDVQGVAYSANGETCFFCSQALTDPAVHWMGHAAPGRDGIGRACHLFLHADCAVDLFVRLMRDVHELRHPDYYRRRSLRGLTSNP